MSSNENADNINTGEDSETKHLSLALFEAVEEGNIDRLSQLLDEAREHGLGIDDFREFNRPSFRYNRGNTLLIDAALEGHIEICELLLTSGMSVNLKNVDGFTALHKAKSLDICELLAEHGADFTVITNRRETVLHYAFDAQIARYFINHGLDVNATTCFGQTCIGAILMHPEMDRRTKVEVCKVLLENGADEDCTNTAEDDSEEGASGRPIEDIGKLDEQNNEDDAMAIIELAKSEMNTERKQSITSSRQWLDISGKKVYICGSKRSGKTTLYRSLLRGKLRSKMTLERVFSDMWPPIYYFVQGINIAVNIVEKDYISGINGYFNFREFSSKAPYFLVNAMFTNGKHPLICVLYDLKESESECKQKLNGWLAQIKASRNNMWGEVGQETILVIATHADCPSIYDVNYPTKREAAKAMANIIFANCKEKFNELNIIGPFLVDARLGQDEGVVEIRNTLKSLKSTLQCPIIMDNQASPSGATSHEVMHRMCVGIINAKRGWILSATSILSRSDALFKPKFPVLKWDGFKRKVKDTLKDVDNDDIETHLKSVTNILNYWDELIFVEREPCSESIIVLRSQWITSTLFVPLFFAEARHKYLIPESVGYDKSDLENYMCEKGWNYIQTDVIMELAGHFGLLFTSPSDNKIILPTRLPDEEPIAQQFSNGVSYELQDETDIMLPTFFAKLLFELMNEYASITQLFKKGARINGADVTGHVFFKDDHRKIFVLTTVRQDEGELEAQELKLLNEISSCIEKTIINSGRLLRLKKKFLHRGQLQRNEFDTIEGLENIRSFTVEELIDAERKHSGEVVCAKCAARVTDVLIKGHDVTVLKALGDECNAVWLPDEIYVGADGLEGLFGRRFVTRDGNARESLIRNLGLDDAGCQNMSVRSIVCKWAGINYERNNVGEFCKILTEMERLDAVTQVRSVLDVIGENPSGAEPIPVTKSPSMSNCRDTEIVTNPHVRSSPCST